jgi:hypothetical protein
MTICADHAERSSCASNETGVTSIEYEDECCSVDSLRFLRPERIQKTQAGHVMRPLPLAKIFGLSHRRTRDMTGAALQPAISPHLHRTAALRV